MKKSLFYKTKGKNLYQKINIEKRTKSENKNRFESNNLMKSNDLEQMKNENSIINNKKRNINYNFMIPAKVMKTILNSMNKNTNLSFINNLKSFNFFYQTYERGIDALKNKFDRNKTFNIEKYIEKRKRIAKIPPNFSLYSTIIGNYGLPNENYEQYKIDNNYNDIMNTNKTFYKKKQNRYTLVSPNHFRKALSGKPNSQYHSNTIINKTKKIFKIINQKYPSTNRNNYNQMENNKNMRTKVLRYKIFQNERGNDNSNELMNFGFVPIYSTRFKNRENKKDCGCESMSLQKKPPLFNKIIKNDEIINKLKVFTEKYEKEKENFNNVLFDECIELRKKKFKLETFLKKFNNKQFVEKLYKAKEYSIKKKS